MEPNLQNAYDQFLQTGRIADYLQYAALRDGGAPDEGFEPPGTGDVSAHYDRRDRSAGARG